MNAQDENLIKIWRQEKIPVIFRRKGKSLLIKVPFAPDNSVWLRTKPKNKEPIWNAQYKCWELPRSRFDFLTKTILESFSQIFIVQPYRKQDKCAPACWNAEGFECECSCMGEHHGAGNHHNNWFVVSDTFATKWHELEYSCRLLEVSSGAL